MRTFAAGLPLTLAVAALVAVGVHAPAQAEPDAAWVARMDGLAAALAQLLPDALAPDSVDPARDERLRKNARLLSGLAHDMALVDPKKLPDSDPTVPLLTRELGRAIAGTDHASGEALKDAALVVAQTCIGCHTRTDAGAPRPRLSLPPPDASLAPWLRADVLAATRRFEDARTAYGAVIKDERFAEKEPLLWERTVKHALVLEVRTARDPRGALALVEQVLSTPAIEHREGLQRDALAWRRSLRAWVDEPPRRVSSRDGLYALASRLMDQASTLARAPDDSSADILYLRATSALHELLGKYPPADMRAQSLSWLGESYEALRDLDVWSLYLLYDEACIEAAPHSVVAGECYTRLRRGTLVEQTGNGGAPLDDAVAANLARLHELAR